MAYDEHLADRVRDLLAGEHAVAEIRMFGGWCVTIRGHMVAGVIGDDLIVRVGPDAYETALGSKGARVFDFTGRPSRGIVVVDGSAVRTRAPLAKWVARGCEYAVSLPPKPPRKRRPPQRR